MWDTSRFSAATRAGHNEKEGVSLVSRAKELLASANTAAVSRTAARLRFFILVFLSSLMDNAHFQKTYSILNCLVIATSLTKLMFVIQDCLLKEFC